MAIRISQPTPLLCLQHSRFTSGTGWQLFDLCVGETDVIAVSGYHGHTERTFIDLYTNFSDREKPNIPSSIEFEPHVGLRSRFVSFLEQIDRIVTCIGDQLEIVATTAENKTLKHQVLQGSVVHLNTWSGNIFVGFDKTNDIVVYDQQLNIVNVIYLKGIPPREFCMDIHFTPDACFVCTTAGRAMKLSTRDGNALYDFDVSTRETAQWLAVSDGLGVVFIVWQWNEIRVYSIEENNHILFFHVDNVVYRIRVSDKGTIVIGNFYSGEVKVYNVAYLFNYHQLKQTLSHLLTKNQCAKLADFLDVDLHLESSTGSAGEMLFDVLESSGIVDPYNVERLSKALLKLDMKSPYGQITDIFQKLRPHRIVQPKKLPSIPSVAGGTSEFVSFSEGDQKTKRVQTNTSENETDPTTKKKYKILHVPCEPSVGDEDKETYASPENIFLKTDAIIGQSGGELRISNTRVQLRIPPNALPAEIDQCVIQLRIIPQEVLKDKTVATFWNTSAVVELLPNSLKLRKDVKLTLPHGFVLKEPRPSARVLVSHHEQGDKPYWVENTDCSYKVEQTTCILQVKSFCWIRLKIDENEVVAKKLILYTAGKKPVPNCNKFTVVVGYYPDLPGEDKFFQLNQSLIVTERKLFNYYKERDHPLRLLLKDTIPESWKLCAPKEKMEEINFETISSSVEHSRPFTFQNKGKRFELPILHFEASQEGGMQPVELTINVEELRVHPPQPERNHPDPMKLLCRNLSEELTDEWKEVGRNLNITDAKLHQIKTDNAGNIKETIYAMFLHWIQNGGANVTRSTLSAALKTAGRADLAHDVD